MHSCQTRLVHDSCFPLYSALGSHVWARRHGRAFKIFKHYCALGIQTPAVIPPSVCLQSSPGRRASLPLLPSRPQKTSKHNNALHSLLPLSFISLHIPPSLHDYHLNVTSCLRDATRPVSGDIVAVEDKFVLSGSGSVAI